MAIPNELIGVLESTPNTLSGAVRFVGTRVPVQALLDTILCGESVEYFLEDFPDVSREQAMLVVAWRNPDSFLRTEEKLVEKPLFRVYSRLRKSHEIQGLKQTN